MAFKIEIVNNALSVTETISGDIAVFQPNGYTWYEEDSLVGGFVKFYGTTDQNEKNTNKYEYNKVGRSFKGFPIAECVDSGDVVFTAETFRTFASLNLGKLNASGGAYTQEEVDESVRKSINPFKLITYLDPTTPFTTVSIPVNTPFKLLIPTTVTSSNGFALGDTGGGNIAYIFTDPNLGTYPFEVRMVTAITSSVNNVELIVYGYKNGVAMNGITAELKITTGGVFVQAIMMSESSISSGDYIEVYVEVDKACTLTFHRTAINIMESN